MYELNHDYLQGVLKDCFKNNDCKKFATLLSNYADKSKAPTEGKKVIFKLNAVVNQIAYKWQMDQQEEIEGGSDDDNLLGKSSLRGSSKKRSSRKSTRLQKVISKGSKSKKGQASDADLKEQLEIPLNEMLDSESGAQKQTTTQTSRDKKSTLGDSGLKESSSEKRTSKRGSSDKKNIKGSDKKPLESTPGTKKGLRSSSKKAPRDSDKPDSSQKTTQRLTSSKKAKQPDPQPQISPIKDTLPDHPSQQNSASKKKPRSSEKKIQPTPEQTKKFLGNLTNVVDTTADADPMDNEFVYKSSLNNLSNQTNAIDGEEIQLDDGPGPLLGSGKKSKGSQLDNTEVLSEESVGETEGDADAMDQESVDEVSDREVLGDEEGKDTSSEDVEQEEPGQLEAGQAAGGKKTFPLNKKNMYNR